MTKVHEWNEAMRWLTRPADKFSKAEKKAIVGNFHKKNEEFWKKNDEKVGSPIKTREIKKIVEKPKPLNNMKFDSYLESYNGWLDVTE